jgi:peptide/nickel transport system substrate-binding protein
MGYWGFDRLSVIKADPGRWTGQIDDGPWAPTYGHWYVQSPWKQEEPPADHPIRRMWALWDATQVEPDEARRNATFQELLNMHKAAPYVVGVVGETVAPMIASQRFRNVLAGFIADDTLRDSGLINPQSFFIRR